LSSILLNAHSINGIAIAGIHPYIHPAIKDAQLTIVKQITSKSTFKYNVKKCIIFLKKSSFQNTHTVFNMIWMDG